MSTFLNLLHNVERHNIHQYSFLTRLHQNYRLFAGHLNPENPHLLKPHMGVFDYLTFGIPALIEWIFDNLLSGIEKAADRDDHFAGIIIGFLLFIVGIIHIPLKLANMLFGAVGALISLPFMTIAHLILFVTKKPSTPIAIKIDPSESLFIDDEVNHDKLNQLMKNIHINQNNRFSISYTQYDLFEKPVQYNSIMQELHHHSMKSSN